MNIIDKFFINTYERVAFSSYTLAKFAKADRYFRKVLAIEPNRPGTCYNLGMVNYGMGNYDEALKFVLKEREHEGDVYAITRALGDIYWHRRDRKEAYDNFKLSKESALSDIDKNLMERKMAICESDEAFADALAAEKIFAEADKLMSEKLYDQAEELYLKGVEKDPSNFLAYNNLGVIAMNIRMNYVNAEKYFQSAYEICSLKMVEDNMENLLKLRRKTGR